MRRPAGTVLAIVLSGAIAIADEPRSGEFDVVFTERHPLSAMPTLAGRRQSEAPADYVLAEESFKVYVPQAGASGGPYGLMVWVSPIDRLPPFPEWLSQTLEKHGVIFIAAYRSGNQRESLHRWGLALDAAHNVAARYPIDERRVYVAGFSGGGRTASMLAVLFPEVFRGAFSVCGVNFFRRVSDPSRPGYAWNYFQPPPKKKLKRARAQRLVLLTGENDSNRLQTEIYTREYRAEGFEHVTYLEVPGLGHRVPNDPVWWDRAFEALDAPLGAGGGD